MKLHKVTIKNREPGNVSVGANTVLLIDGKPLKGVKSYTLECDVRSLTKLTLEMYVSDVDVVIDEIGNYEQTYFKADKGQKK